MASSSSSSHPDESANKRKHVDYETRCGSGGGGGGEERRGYPSREDTPPAQCSVLCGPRSCSTLPSTLGNQNDCGTSPPEPKRRRLWGLRGLVKMFRRRVRRKGGGSDASESPQAPAPALRARSASELTVDPVNRGSGGPYNQGLSVSHDSVFSPESPTEQTHTAPPGLSLATRGVNMSELKEALRRGRGLDSGSVEDDPDDPGLPRSPQTSPTTLDVLNHGLKSSSRGAQSSCSDGSLLSMGSSENDEDSFGVISHYSSKHSLIEGRHQTVVDNEPAVGAAPLSHKAARHKISVRPKRTHGIPRSRKQAQSQATSLPTTPEVNEDSSSRSERVSLNNSFSPYSKPQEAQRPSSVSFSALENQFIKSRSERIEVRKSERKSLPNPPISLAHIEDKREDELLNRLFDSGRSPHTQQLGEVIPPLPRDDFQRIETRLSREKRKDPFRTSTGTKSSRQKSDPSRITYLNEPSVERSSSHRSSSVEGRLEGNPLENHLYPVERPPPPPPFDVNGIVEPEMSYRVDTLDPVKVSRNIAAANRLSASYDSLNEDEIMSSSLTSHSQIGNSLESCEGRSSTDSLTTTPLPGIYIRSNQSTARSRRSSSHSQTMGSVPHFREDNYHQMMMQDRENSGPLSLDSSLSLVQHEEEFRKTVSVEEVVVSRGIVDHHDFKEHIQTPRPVTIMRSVSVHSPATSSRGSSIRSRRSSGGDDLESDSSLPKVSLRKVRREPSLKKTSNEEATETVPEFMRIQLNRVQNKGNSIVIFDTEQKNQSTPSSKAIVSVREWSEVSQQNERCSVAINETEKIRDQSEIIINEKNSVELIDPILKASGDKMEDIDPNSKQNKIHKTKTEIEQSVRPVKSKIFEAPIYVQPMKSKPMDLNLNIQSSKSKGIENDQAVTRDSVQPGRLSGKRRSSEDKVCKEDREEFILRRPSVVDRSVVIDQSMGALPSSPTAKRDGDEPELFKVFARRSFKLKDAEMDDVLKEESNVEGDKENHLPTQTKEENDGQKNPLKRVDRSGSGTISGGNTNLPLAKPFAPMRETLPNSILGIPNSVEPKPTFIVFSGKNLTLEEARSSSAEPIEAEQCYTKTSPTPKEKVANTFGKSSPQIICHSRNNSGLDSDGNFSSSSEDNLEIGNKISKSGNRLKKVHPVTKPIIQNGSPILKLSPGTQHKNIEDKEPQPRASELASSNFTSSIIRRSIVSSSRVASNEVSEVFSVDDEDLINSRSSPRGQAVIWPPKSQPNSLTDGTEGNSVTIGTPPSSRFPLPHSKILNSFKDQPVYQSTVETDPQVANDNEVMMREKKGRGSVEYRKRSLIESVPSSPPILAEARNTTFAHSFESHTSPLTLSYLNKGDSSLKLDRKGSMDEGRNSIGGPEDWRMLVRQRREDRIKQSKTPDTEEIIIETRPAVSRNSKVLEMANNFQKLQVA